MNSYTKTLFNDGNDSIKKRLDGIEFNYNIKENNNRRSIVFKEGNVIEAYATGKTLGDADENLEEYFKTITRRLTENNIRIVGTPQKYVPQEIHNMLKARRDFKVDRNLLKELQKQCNEFNNINSKGVESQKNKITPLVLSSIYNEERPSKNLPKGKVPLSSELKEHILKNNGIVDFRHGQNY